MINKKRKKILFIAARFVPANSSGVYRLIGFLRYLNRELFEPMVLTLHDYPGVPIDTKLYSFVPGDVTIFRTSLPPLMRSFKNSFKKSFENRMKNHTAVSKESFGFWKFTKKALKSVLYFPDSYSSWVLNAVPFALKNISKPDYVFATAPPFSSLLLAVILSNIWKVPFIADFRDPWSINPFFSHSKYKQKFIEIFENCVLNSAYCIIMNTQESLELYQKKYKNYFNKFYYIPNGFDDIFYVQFSNMSEYNPSTRLLNIVHCGSLYGFRNPSPLLDVLSRFKYAKFFKFQFYGFVSNTCSPSVFPKCVSFYDTIPFLESLYKMYNSDIILLYGNCNKKSVQIPRKVYDIMPFNRPIFLIDTKESPTFKLLSSLKISFFYSENASAQIEKTLKEIYSLWKSKKLFQYAYRPPEINNFNIKNLTIKLEKLLS